MHLNFHLRLLSIYLPPTYRFGCRWSNCVLTNNSLSFLLSPFYAFPVEYLGRLHLMDNLKSLLHCKTSYLTLLRYYILYAIFNSLGLETKKKFKLQLLLKQWVCLIKFCKARNSRQLFGTRSPKTNTKNQNVYHCEMEFCQWGWEIQRTHIFIGIYPPIFFLTKRGYVHSAWCTVDVVPCSVKMSNYSKISGGYIPIKI